MASSQELSSWNDRWYSLHDGRRSKQVLGQQGEVLYIRIRPKDGPEDGSADRFTENGKSITSRRAAALDAGALLSAATTSTPRDTTQLEGSLQSPSRQGSSVSRNQSPSYDIIKPNTSLAQRPKPNNTNKPQTDVTINPGAEEKPVSTSQAISPPERAENWDEITLNATGVLPKTYFVRHANWFCLGRVFRIWLSDPMGSTAPAAGGKDNKTYGTIRPWVVVKRNPAHCICLPVVSYGAQGVAKRGLKNSERSFHAVLHSEDTGAQLLDTERQYQHLLKPAFKVKLSANASLNMASRIRFDKPRAIECNLKVCDVGVIRDDQLARLQEYYGEACAP